MESARGMHGNAGGMHGNVGECRGMPGERKGVGVMCQGKQGDAGE